MRGLHLGPFHRPRTTLSRNQIVREAGDVNAVAASGQNSNARPGSWLRAAEIVPVFAVGIAAFLVRAIPVFVSGGFPLNDGGLFYVMTRDLQANSFVIPAATSYNGGDIPFAYPPLGIYLAALLHLALPVSLIDVFTWLPVVLSLLSVAAFFYLALELLPSRFHALVATAAFAVAPESYMWTIEGGGVTRALGLLFALLSVIWTVKYLRSGSGREGAVAAVAGGLAVLSHPNAALYTVLAVVLLAAQARNIGRSLHILFGIAIVSAPWWVGVTLRLGPMELISAASLNGPVLGALQGFFGLLFFMNTQEVTLPFVAAAGFLGLLLCIHRGSLLLLGWVALELMLDPRLGPRFAMVPLCLAAAYGVVDVVIPAFLRVSNDGDALMPDALWRTKPIRDGLLVVLYIATLGWLVFDLTSLSPEHALPAATREAYQWVAGNTPADARFAVITGDPAGLEGSQDWFPALTSRVSEATPQGVEWLGATKWRATYDDNVALQACAAETAGCLLAWASARGNAPDFVLLPKGQLNGSGSPADCCSPLRQSLLESRQFSVAYDGPGATIARWLPDPVGIIRIGRELLPARHGEAGVLAIGAR